MEISIDKLIYGGDGLGRLPPDDKGRGKAVFVPFVLEGERVSVSLLEQRPGFARAALDQVLQPSPLRALAPCPYFTRCGGCHYQHTGYDHQLDIKAAILQETLHRTAKIQLSSPLQVHHDEPWQYRNRTRMKVRTAPEFAIGYFHHGSHELLPVEECPISSPLINRALEVIWEVGRTTRVPETLREIQFFADHADSRLLLEFYIDHKAADADFGHLAAELRSALPAIIGVALLETPHRGEDEASQRPSSGNIGKVFGEGALEYQVAGTNYRVSAGSFFQVNRHLAADLVSTALHDTTGSIALDLYAGTGLFSVPLAQRFERVIAVEASPQSHADLKHNAPRNVRAVRATTEQYLSQAGSKARFDLVLLDPPRGGLGEKLSRALGRMHVQRVTYVSCDPATLSRDLRVLLEAGFRVDEAHLFDLFPQTFHMESVFHLVR